MMFKTHAAAGIASAVFITHPNDIKSLFICGAAACIGSVISDIDVTTSKSRKGLGKIIAIAGIAAAVTCVAGNFFLNLEFLLIFKKIQVLCKFLWELFFSLQYVFSVNINLTELLCIQL